MFQEDSPRPSPDLQAAQARLLQLRAERGVPARGGVAAVAEATAAGQAATVNWPLVNARKELARLRSTLRIGVGQPVEQPFQVVVSPQAGKPVEQPFQVVASPQAGKLALQPPPVEQPFQVVASPQAGKLALQQPPVEQPFQVVVSPQAGKLALQPPVEQPFQVVASPHDKQATRQISGMGQTTSYSHSDETITHPAAHTPTTPSRTASATTAATYPANTVAAIASSIAARIAPNAAGPSPGAAVAQCPRSVKVYPDIALGMLRGDQAAAGRVWLLLRAIDVDGRGWLAADAARAALCDAASPLRLCGRRRLRQLLAGGERLFWQRDDRDRVWLHGPARVAAGLGVARLGNRPIDVPLAALLGGIGDVRAHLYATFHSGRAKEMTSVEHRGRAANSPVVLRHSSLGAPIARDTLADLSGVCPRSQAAYERRAGIVARANIALGERVAAARATGGSSGPAEQERAWRHGRALFRFKDHHGRQGLPGATYLAWRLPNGYGAGRGHRQRPKGRQKRINRQLADLFTKGMTGNGESTIVKRFFATASAAFKVQGSGGAEEQGRKGDGRRVTGGLGACRRLLPTAHRRPAAYWPLTTAHSSAVSGWGVWAVADRAVAHGMNPTAASRNLLKQVRGGPTRDANRLQPILIDRGGFESA